MIMQQETSAVALTRLLRERSAAAGARPGHPKTAPPISPLRWARRSAGSLRSQYRLWTIDTAGQRLGTTHIVRSLPEFAGEFELDLRSHITRSLLLGCFERFLLPVVKASLQPNMDAIDVGANVGLYTVLISRLIGPSGRLLAAEPAPTVLPLLRSNIQRNGLPNVLLFEGIVTSEQGQGTLNFVPGNEEYSSLAALSHPNAPRDSQHLVSVEQETLDALVARHNLRPAFVKIDVEGAEERVLRGADTLLRTHRPTLLSELDDRLLQPLGASARSVLELLAGVRYRAFDARSGAELVASRLPEPFTGEIVAIPEEQAAS
jgi:FkbM family methyltransferase